MPSPRPRRRWTTRARTTAISSVLVWAAGCGDALLDGTWEGGTYLTITGPVDPGTPVATGELAAAVAWIWVADGRMGSVVEPVSFEPRVYSYSLAIEHPPERGASVAAPPALTEAGEVALLLGSIVLYETDVDPPVEFTSEPSALLDAVLGHGMTQDTVHSSTPGEARVIAGWPEHRLGAFSGTGGIHALAGTPGWPVEGPLCELDALEGGLTLYRDEGAGCGRWTSVAPAGERTEFQGVPLAPFPGG